MASPSATFFLDHFGLGRPYRFERAILAGLAILLAAVWMRAINELPLRGPRGEYFLYLLILFALGLALVRWSRLAGVVLVLLAFELGGRPAPEPRAAGWRWPVRLVAAGARSRSLADATEVQRGPEADGGWPGRHVGVDFVDQGHFSARGAKRFADDLAQIVCQLCR